MLNKRKQSFYTLEEHGFTVGYAKRQYQVKGIQRGDTQLKATIKVSEDIEKNKPFELTTIDLYSSRSRHWFAKLCADLFQEPEALTPTRDVATADNPVRATQSPGLALEMLLRRPIRDGWRLHRQLVFVFVSPIRQCGANRLGVFHTRNVVTSKTAATSNRFATHIH